MTDVSRRPWLVPVGLAGALVALGAVVLEVLAGQRANSPPPGWSALVPITWPPVLRVAWWLFVASAVLAFRLALVELGAKPRPVLTAATVLPFVAFAGGVAVGADWATWH